MSTLTERIRPWTQNPPRNSPVGEIAILVLEENDAYTWLAIVTGDNLKPIALVPGHQTRHDAVVDAIEHVPNWNIIRTL